MKIILFQYYSPYACPDYDEMAKYMRQLGHEAIVTHMGLDRKLQLRNDSKVDEYDIFPWKLRNIRYLGFLSRRVSFIIFYWRLKKIIRKENPDFFIVASSALMLLSLIPVLIRNTKIIFDIRQIGFTPGSGFKAKQRNFRLKIRYRILSRFFYDHTCFAFSAAAEVILGKNWRMKKASVMEVGVGKQFLDSTFNNILSTADKLRMVYIGSLARVRRLEFLIDAVKIITSSSENLHLTLIGYDENEYYTNYVRRNDLAEFITVKQPIPYQDVPGELNKYHFGLAYVPEHPDWLYQPTLKVKEYTALGMPILATDNLPNQVFVKNYKTGILFHNSIPNFSEIVITLLEDINLCQSLFKNSQHSQSISSWKDSANNYLELMRQMKTQQW